jgi:hypothetical protein
MPEHRKYGSFFTPVVHHQTKELLEEVPIIYE